MTGIKCALAIAGLILLTGSLAYSRPYHESFNDCSLRGHPIYVPAGLNYPRSQWARWGIRCRAPKPEGVAKSEEVAKPESIDGTGALDRHTANFICQAMEQSAAHNGLPVRFFARVIWQESRFNTRAVSPKGAEGIAQFMPQTAAFRGLDDPFKPIPALRKAARYLADLRSMFGNLGLAAAGYNAGPARVSAWLHGKRTLPDQTRNYVKIITGLSAEKWASPKPPKMAVPANPAGVSCLRLGSLTRSTAKK